MGFRPPTHTQMPNEVFDDWLPSLKFGELKVLMVVIRKTFGWHKVKDHISLSQLSILTGLTKTNVCVAVKSLVEKGMIKKVCCGDIGHQETFYELCVDEFSNNSTQSCKRTTPPVLQQDYPPSPPPSPVAGPTKESNINLRRNPPLPPPSPKKKEEEDLSKKDSREGKLKKIKEKWVKEGRIPEGIDAAFRAYREQPPGSVLAVEAWLDTVYYQKLEALEGEMIYEERRKLAAKLERERGGNYFFNKVKDTLSYVSGNVEFVYDIQGRKKGSAEFWEEHKLEMVCNKWEGESV